ncbi:MAG: hypothetical protein WA691_04390 [Thermoplasmata archaeon]
MKVKRRHLWTIVVAVATIILLVLLSLIALGYLVLPGAAPPAPVEVNQIDFTLDQGTNSSGYGWFGPNTFNYTGIANGYPYSVAGGAAFTVPLILENYDNNSHPIYSISVEAPFTLTGTTPVLPVTIPALLDDASFQLDFRAPSSPGVTLTMFVTINADMPS